MNGCEQVANELIDVCICEHERLVHREQAAVVGACALDVRQAVAKLMQVLVEVAHICCYRSLDV